MRGTQKYLTEALIELMDTINVHKITVIMLCKKAQVNRSTFYSHYTDMNDFLFKILKDMTSGILEAEPGLSSNPTQMLNKKNGYKYYCTWFTYVHANHTFFKKMMGPNGMPEFIDMLTKQGVSWYTELLRPMMPVFENKVSIDVLANYIVSAHMGLQKFYLESDMKYSIEYMAKQLYYLTFDGPFSVLNLLTVE